MAVVLKYRTRTTSTFLATLRWIDPEGRECKISKAGTSDLFDGLHNDTLLTGAVPRSEAYTCNRYPAKPKVARVFFKHD